MYTIRPHCYKDHGVCYDQYILEDTSAGTALTITPEKGGSITGMTLHGEEFIWLRYPNFYRTERPRYGIPVLFPQCGASPQGQNRFGGQSYPMCMHGFACLVPWQVVDTCTDDGASMTLRLTESALTRVLYPFAFCLDLTYTLKGRTVTISQSYHNSGDTEMPFAFGFLPYFAVQDVRGLQFELHADRLVDPETGAAIPCTDPTRLPCEGEQSWRFYRGAHSPASFTDPASGRRVVMQFDKNFDHLVLWSQCQMGFVSLAPWNGWPGGLNTGRDFQLLPAGETLEAVCSFTMEKL